MGHDVTVIRRSSYITDDKRMSEYRGVRLVDVYAPRRKSIEAIVHTFLAVFKAVASSPTRCISMPSALPCSLPSPASWA